MSRHLGVWMNGERVGTWTWLRGTHRFNYHHEWQHSPRYRPLSLSMPWTGNTLQGDQVGWFFDNLLPDNPDVHGCACASWPPWDCPLRVRR